MSDSARRTELTEAAYGYVLDHGLAGVSLRPVAAAVGSSTGVLRFLYGSKDGLVAALLDRLRADERTLLAGLPAGDPATVATAAWAALAEPARRPALRLWAECAAAAPVTGSGFAADSARDWLDALARAQPSVHRRTAAGRAQRTAVLALLRGGVLDLLATGERTRVDRAVRGALGLLG